MIIIAIPWATTLAVILLALVITNCIIISKLPKKSVEVENETDYPYLPLENINCDNCKGTGLKPKVETGVGIEPCPECTGTGIIV